MTHVICTNLALSKEKRALDRLASDKVIYVTDEWISACINENKRVSPEPFFVIKDKKQPTLSSFFKKT